MHRIVIAGWGKDWDLEDGGWWGIVKGNLQIVQPSWELGRWGRAQQTIFLLPSCCGAEEPGPALRDVMLDFFLF